MNELTIEELHSLYAAREIVWSSHVLKRLQMRGIFGEDVEQCIMSGEIIEQYPDDFPYPSCLILGWSTGKQYLHTVIGRGEGKLWVITAYYPSPDKWESDFKTRKRG